MISIPCVLCLYALLKVVSYYDLSVLSMSVMCIQNKTKFGKGVGSFLGVFLTLQCPKILEGSPRHSAGRH